MAEIITPMTVDVTFEEWKDKTNQLIDVVTNDSNEVDTGIDAVNDIAIAIAIALG